MRELFLPIRPSRRRVVVTAVLAPAVAVALASVLGSRNLASATALSLLAVVVASAVAGRSSGMLASLVSFVGLNFFFTEPLHTFIVHDASDLVALFVFLISAAIVGSLLSHALEQRDRAERRATEAQLLSHTAARLISGEPFDRILTELASALVPLFGLIRCEIDTQVGVGSAVASDGGNEGPSVTLPLATESASVGFLTATRALDEQLFSSPEVAVLESLARQTALAVERAALDREVQRVKLEAETSSIRAALFSSVTHDLKTPLSSIKASATGLIAKGAEYTDEQRDEMARTVIEEADHLDRILANLMDLARMRAGALVPSRQYIFLEDVIASALRRMRRTLEGFEVRTNFRPQLSPIEADPVQIEQVISNLLENAMRFSPKGSELKIAVSQWHGTVQTRVSDHGPGIPEEDRDRVFDEFFSRDAGLSRGGTGLGLAIARAVVLAHGGRIWVESAPGGGATVGFEVPAAQTADGDVGPLAPVEGVSP